MAANMVVRTNVFSLNAHRNMKNVGLEQRRSSNRLASGFRINSAADDAAGLAISENMRAQIRGLDQASRNAQDGQAMILTTEGGLDQIGEMLVRVRELLVQASNDTNTQGQRTMIEQEVRQLAQEISSMQNRVEFNTNRVLAMGPGMASSVAADMANIQHDMEVLSNNFADVNENTRQVAVARELLSALPPNSTFEDLNSGQQAQVLRALEAVDLDIVPFRSDIDALDAADVNIAEVVPGDALTLTEVIALLDQRSNDLQDTATVLNDRINALHRAAENTFGTIRDFAEFTAIDGASADRVPGEWVWTPAPGTPGPVGEKNGPLALTPPAAGSLPSLGAAGETFTYGAFEWSVAAVPEPDAAARDAAITLAAINAAGAVLAAEDGFAAGSHTFDIVTATGTWEVTATFEADGSVASAAEDAVLAAARTGALWTGNDVWTATARADMAAGVDGDILTDDAGRSFRNFGGTWYNYTPAVVDPNVAPEPPAGVTAPANPVNEYAAAEGITVKVGGDTIGTWTWTAATPALDLPAMEAGSTGNNVAFFQVGANANQGVTFDFETVSRAVTAAASVVTMVGTLISNPSEGSGIGRGISVTPLINEIQSSLDDINSVRANLGAIQNRLDFTMRSLDISSENLSDSESRVRNADIAREMMRFTMQNVLQQAAVSMLSQANQLPQNLLQLLR